MALLFSFFVLSSFDVNFLGSLLTNKRGLFLVFSSSLVSTCAAQPLQVSGAELEIFSLGVFSIFIIVMMLRWKLSKDRKERNSVPEFVVNFDLKNRPKSGGEKEEEKEREKKEKEREKEEKKRKRGTYFQNQRKTKKHKAELRFTSLELELQETKKLLTKPKIDTVNKT